LQDFEAIAAAAAVDAALPPTERDVRPCVTIKVTGHLFDKAVLNRLVDLAVDSDCEFRVRIGFMTITGAETDILKSILRLSLYDAPQVDSLNVAPVNEQHSSVILRIWDRNEVRFIRIHSGLFANISNH